MRMRPAVMMMMLLPAIMVFGCGSGRLISRPGRPEVRFIPLASDGRISHELHAEDPARVVASLLPESIAAVERELHRPFVKDVRVKVFATAGSFAATTGVTRREWGVMLSGTVFLSGIVKTAPKHHIGALLTHELVHLYLHQRRGVTERHSTLPMWFEEGLAELVSGGSAMIMVTEAEATRAILEGRHLFSGSEDAIVSPERCTYGVESHMFYRQAEMFVAYLRSLDETRFRALLLALADGRDFEGSWLAHFGSPLPVAWRRFLDTLRSGSRER